MKSCILNPPVLSFLFKVVFMSINTLHFNINLSSSFPIATKILAGILVGIELTLQIDLSALKMFAVGFT